LDRKKALRDHLHNRLAVIPPYQNFTGGPLYHTANRPSIQPSPIRRDIRVDTFDVSGSPGFPHVSRNESLTPHARLSPYRRSAASAPYIDPLSESQRVAGNRPRVSSDASITTVLKEGFVTSGTVSPTETWSDHTLTPEGTTSGHTTPSEDTDRPTIWKVSHAGKVVQVPKVSSRRRTMDSMPYVPLPL